MTIDSKNPDPAQQLSTLLSSEPYWTAAAMKAQGSRFYQALGHALDAADLQNRRLIYQTWQGALWDFYQRGLVLKEAEG